MNIRQMIFWTAIGLLGLFQGCVRPGPELSGINPDLSDLTYPVSPRIEMVETFHGIKISDPYRWLEDIDSEQTADWIGAQNELTSDYLDGVAKRDAIRERLTLLWDYEKYGIPFSLGGRYFYTHNDGLQNQDVLFWSDSLESPANVLLDPNDLSKDGTIALSSWSVSDDGKMLAYALSEAGSDWKEWRVRDIATGRDLDDHLRWSKFTGAAWSHDHRGFYYSRYDEPNPGTEMKGSNTNQKVYFHALGTGQDQDQLVYERPDNPEWGLNAGETEDGRWLIIYVRHGANRLNGVFYRDLQDPGAPVVELLDTFDAKYWFIGNNGPVFYFQTDFAAPRNRLVAIDIRQPDRKHWLEIIPESDDTLQRVSLVADTFIATYLHHAHSRVRLFEMDGSFIRDVELPGMGSAGGFGGKRRDQETFYIYTGFLSPGTIHRYDVSTGRTDLFRKPEINFNPGLYESRQVFFKSRDGTRIPMFLVHRKDIELNQNNPVLLYGYGGFGNSMTPYFSVSRLIWMDMGGIVALPNLRGGGEYGRAWHEAGKKLNKQNVFDDFMAAAQWLIDQGYTSPERLAIMGGSNGGLLVGACLTQKPELFGAALPRVGVMDMLRFDKFTIGWAWKPEYGDPAVEEEFNYLHSYSPYHNLEPGTKYPATLVTTGDHDDRVFPAHSFKFAAALQNAHAGKAPVLIRVQTRAGHGAGKPTAMIIDEITDIWSFLIRVFDLD